VSRFATRQLDDDYDDDAGEFPVDDSALPARVVSPRDGGDRYPQVIHPAAIQPGHYAPHPHQILDPAHVARLMGTPTRQAPRWLTGVKDVFGHAADHHILPAAGVLTLFGVAAWAHSQPYHPLIGGSLIAVGAYLMRAGIHGHRHHGADADAVFTKGLLGAGATLSATGAVACAGLSPWSVLALALATGGSYVAWHQWQHHKTERAREFTVALVAAGNTGPTPLPPVAYAPGALPYSDEEGRLRAAFLKIAPEVILGPVRRLGADGDTWYVYADLSDTDKTAEQVVAQSGKIATKMGARLVEIEPGNRPSLVKVTVYDGDDPLEGIVHWDGSTVASILDPIRLGLFEDGSDVEISLAWKHTLVCGTTDMGKSGVLNLVLCSTLPCPDVVRILTDCKEGAPEFRAYKDVSFFVATTPEEGMRVLAGLEAVYKHRGQMLVDNDVPPSVDEDGETVQKWEARFGPFILASIDELTELTGSVPGAAKRIQSLRAKMRFVGMFALDATQFPDQSTFGGTTTARMNYLNRVSLAIAEQGGTNIIFGQGMHGRNWRPDLLDAPGKMFVYSPTNKRPRKARALRVDPQAVARAVAAARGGVPDLDEGSATAFWDAYHAAENEESGGGGPRGGRKEQSEPQDATAYGRPHLVVVPSYPDGTQVDERDRRLWRLLGEYGSAGATAVDLAARAEQQGHQHKSQAWVRQRLAYWRAQEYVGFEQDGREMRYWRTDLRSERMGDADDASA